MITARLKETLDWTNFFIHIHHAGEVSRIVLGYNWRQERFSGGGAARWLDRAHPGALEVIEQRVQKHGPLVDIVEVWVTEKEDWE